MNSIRYTSPAGLGAAAWCTAFAAVAALAGPVAYVSNEGGGVSVVDLDSGSVVKTLDVGGTGPRGLGVTRDGAWLLTANKGTSDVSVIDTKSGEVVRRISVGKNVEFIRVLDDFAYVTYEPGVTAAPGGEEAKGKEKEKEKDDDVPAEIAVIDLKRWAVDKSLPSGRETEGIDFSPDGKSMAVTNEGDNTVTVYDRASGAKAKSVDTSAFGNRPRGIRTSPDGKQYAVTLEFSDKVLILDEHFKPVSSFATKKGPYGVAYDNDGKRIFVAAGKSSVIQVFDSKTFAELGEIPVGKRCWHFAFSPDGNQLVVACGKSNDLIVADAKTLKVTKTLPGLKGPWGIVTYPKGRGSIDAP